MNKLEELSATSNHGQYLERMAKSLFFSTKQNIPPIITSYGCKTVLDVGCADGSFTKRIADETGAEVTGLDINEKNISIAREKFPNIDFICSELKYLGEDMTFDCILFCSVMHEISSYDLDEKRRFTSEPIREAVELAAKHLNPGGILIVRDGLKPFSALSFSARRDFISPEYQDLFKKFLNEFPPLKRNKELYPYCVELNFRDEAQFYSDEIFIEFLTLVTWGEKSWSREINERKLICTKGEWYGILLNSKLKVNSFTATNEEYPRYCRKFLRNPDSWTMPPTTCLIVAQK